MTVKLFSKAGALVHEQTLPPFVHEQPDVIVWGDRLFCVPSVDGAVARHIDWASDDDYTYEEAFTYTLDPAQV